MSAALASARLSRATASHWAALLGCTPALIYKRAAEGRALDAPVRRAKPAALTPERHAEVVALRGREDVGAVARRYGISRQCVCDLWRRAGRFIEQPPAVEPEPDLHASVEAAIAALEERAERAREMARYTQAVAVEQAWWARRAM